MPYVKRTDGFDATLAAHRGNALGGLNELVRDRSIASDQPTTIVFWTTDDDIQPGDEVFGGQGATPAQNATAYDVVSDPILQTSYEQKFIPDKQATVAEHQTALTAHNLDMQSANLPAFMRQQGEGLRVSLENQLAQAQDILDTDNTELTAIKADLAAGRSVRVERLKTANRPGRTMAKAADRLLGESHLDLEAS